MYSQKFCLITVIYQAKSSYYNHANNPSKAHRKSSTIRKTHPFYFQNCFFSIQKL